MMSLIDANNDAMKNSVEISQEKVRTTLYLTVENKEKLDRIPRGQKTALMNQAIAVALQALERKKNSETWLQMITDIEPVSTEMSSEMMLRNLRENKILVASDNE